MEEELLEDLVLSQKPDYAAEIVEILRSNATPRVIADRLSDYHEADIADILSTVSEAERKKLYRIISVELLSDILESVEEDEASQYLDEMDMRKAAVILSNMEPDKAVVVLREIKKEKRLILIDLLNAEAKKDIALIASYDEDEIGSRMTTNYIEIREDLSIKEAMHSLVEQAPQNDNISTLFVVDEDGGFFGAIDLKDLIIARQGTKLDELIMTSYPYVYGQETIDDCIERLKDYSEDLIPVLDNNNILLGVITSQSVIQVVDDAMADDYAKLAGLTSEEDLQEPLIMSMKKRMPWLLILLALALCVSSVVGVFEKVMAQLTVIVAFQSMVLGMSGNVGTQSLAVTIRVLMDESLTRKQKFGLVGKEARVGFSNGFVVGIMAFVFVGLYILCFKGRVFSEAFAISGCIGCALWVAMTIAAIAGTLIPLFFKKINVDPAVASGPLISTMSDLVAVVTYYGLSWLLLLQVFQLGS